MTDPADKWRAVAEEAYWLLTWTWQGYCLHAPRPFDMSVFAPEAYMMMNESERHLYRALCRATGRHVPVEKSNV